MQTLKIVKDSVLNGATKAVTTAAPAMCGLAVGVHYPLWIGRVVTVDIGWVTASAVAASSYLIFSFSFNLSAQILNSTQLSQKIKLYVPYVVGIVAAGAYCWILPVPTITALSLTALGMLVVTLTNHQRWGDKKVDPNASFLQDVAKNNTKLPKKMEREGVFAVRAALGGLALATLLKVSNWYLGTAMLGWSSAFTFGAINGAVLCLSFDASAWVASKTMDNDVVITSVALLIHGVYFYFSPLSLITNVALTAFGFASNIGIRKLCGV